MNVREKFEQIQAYEKELNSIVQVIEIIDPIRNDTDVNDRHHGTMVTFPEHKSWIQKIGSKISLIVKKKGSLDADPRYRENPISLELTEEIIDSISKSLCVKRDWYRSKIKELES